MENLRRNILLVFNDNAAGIDQLEVAAIVFGLPVNAVTGDAGLVADNGCLLYTSGTGSRPRQPTARRLANAHHSVMSLDRASLAWTS